MKLEYLPEGSEDCPLIRLYGVEPGEFGVLHLKVKELGDGKQTRWASEGAAFLDPSANCLLTLVTSSTDLGIQASDDPTRFVWSLTRGKWKIVAEFMEPFTRAQNGEFHQWLSGENARDGLDAGAISLLISNTIDGQW